VVPLLLLAGLTLRHVFHTSRAVADHGQIDTVRALALAVDGEVRAWKAALTVLAGSESLQTGRLAEFYEEARQVGAQHDGWVVLTVASGEQLFNTLRPYGAPLQKTSSPETIDAIFRHGKPIVSDLIWGRNAQRYLVAVAVPVVRGGKVVNCLTLNFSPERVTRLLQRQELPPTWVAAIVDRHDRVVGRSVRAEERVGKPIAGWLAAATRAAESGIATGTLSDGRPGQVAFQRLHEVAWVAALAVPVAELQSAAPIWGFLSLAAILGLVAIGTAIHVGRKVVVPVQHLAETSERLLRGETGDLGPPSSVREVQELQHALARASAAARVHAEERERSAESLRRANEALEARVAERTAALENANEALRAANADLQEEIAQRKHAESEVHALARFPSENPNPVLRLDSDGRILYANEASADLLAEWRTPVDSPAPAPWPETVRGVLSRNSGTTVELACGDRHYAVFVAPVPEAGYANLYLADVTERKRAEGELRRSEGLYRAIGESIDYGVWVCAPDGRNTYASESFLKMVGLTQEQCSDFGWGAVLHPDDADRTIAAWKACVRTRGVWDIEQRFRGVDGQWHDILARGVPVKDEKGEVLCWAGINLDISRLKRAEAALRSLNADLEQRVADRTAALAQAVQTLERQTDQLRTLTTELTLAEQRERRRLADVLHDELQQLLVATRLRAHMLGRTEDQHVRRGAREIVELIEKALADTRTLSSELNPPGLQRGGLLPALEWLVRWVAEKHHLTVDLSLPSAPLPHLPEETAVLLYQAVRECLLNTVKHAQVREAIVTVVAVESVLTVTVADAGVGFDPARLRVSGGPDGGVGLLGIRERLEWVGGCAEIAGAPGAGSRVTLIVPLRERGAPAAAGAVSAPAEPDSESPPPRRLRVLVVDDHALVRRGFATLLAGEADLEVVGEAANGRQAIELTRQRLPDVILMDVSMQVLKGIETTRAIRAEFPGIRVIGFSMFEEPEQPEAMRQAGAVGYLGKHDSAETLLAAIRAGGAPAA
jgi:PAS domain S-box-containing protein